MPLYSFSEDKMPHVFIDKITIPQDRQRKDMGDIGEMKESLARLGQINPIVLDTDNVLVAGERRLRAAIELGWTQIEVKYWEDLDEFTRQAVELEENIKRKEMTWQETVDAVATYHKLQKSRNPEWTPEHTASALGVSRGYVDHRLQLETAMSTPAGNDLRNTDKFSVARNKAARVLARKAESVIQGALAVMDTTAETQHSKQTKFRIINDNFNTWAQDYRGPKFNLLHCDFPYGINADKIQQGVAVETHGGYADSPDVYWELLNTLKEHADTFLMDNAHMIFWLSWKYFEETKAFLREAGWRVLDYPLIWFKSDNAGLLPDAKRGPRYVNEVALFCTRGDRFIVQAVANTVAHPTESDIHMSIKPEAMLRHFFRMLVDDTTIMLDPTCGSGSSCRAAAKLGASMVLGIEKDPEFYARAKEKLDEEF